MSAHEKKEAPRSLLELYHRARKVLDTFLPIVEFVEALESTADLESRIVGIENYREEVATRVREIDQGLEGAKTVHASALRTLSDELEACKHDIGEQKIALVKELQVKREEFKSVEKGLIALKSEVVAYRRVWESDKVGFEEERGVLQAQLDGLREQLKAVVVGVKGI